MTYGNTIEYVNGEIRMHEIVICENCKHYQGECCVRFGRQEHPHRDPEDDCSKGEKN